MDEREREKAGWMQKKAVFAYWNASVIQITSRLGKRDFGNSPTLQMCLPGHHINVPDARAQYFIPGLT
jgi:hypothetical protein